MSARTLQITIVSYSIWNLIRYIIVGVLVFKANDRNIADVDGYKSSCCDCYYISKNPAQYNLDSQTRFDLSYCIPECTTCQYCEDRFNGSAIASFEYSENPNNTICPIDGYIDDTGEWNWNWNKATGCDDKIGISSLHFFAKSYVAYGYWAITVTILYSLLLIIMAVQAYRMPGISNSLLIYMLIYNILISEICLYLMYKPFQYYHKHIPLLDSEHEAVCEIDSLENATVKTMLTFLIWVSLLITGCHVCYILYKLLFYCRICIKSKRNENRGRQQSINIYYNNKIINGVENRYYKLSAVEAKSYAVKWFVIGGAVLCAMLFFLGLSIYATVVMIRAGVKNKGEYDKWKTTIICVVMSLLFLSFIDSPLIWLKIYEKCKQRNKGKTVGDGLPEPLL